MKNLEDVHVQLLPERRATKPFLLIIWHWLTFWSLREIGRLVAFRNSLFPLALSNQSF